MTRRPLHVCEDSIVPVDMKQGGFVFHHFEWVDEGSKIIVWVITNHQTKGGKQMEISYSDCFKNNHPTKYTNQSRSNDEGLYLKKNILSLI